jgi:hypothetical protein
VQHFGEIRIHPGTLAGGQDHGGESHQVILSGQIVVARIERRWAGRPCERRGDRLGRQDSNLDSRIQSPLCYHCTTTH